MNDLENIPFGLISAWGSALALISQGADTSERLAVVYAVAVGLFVAFRLGHTLFYRAKVPKGRAGCWFGGLFATIAMLVVGLVGVY